MKKILMICAMWYCKFIIQYWGDRGRRLESETSLDYMVRPSLREQSQPESQQCRMWARMQGNRKNGCFAGSTTTFEQVLAVSIKS